MLKKVVAALLVLLVAAAALLYFRAQAIFSSDLVRARVEAQLSSALGQPVSIGSIGASVFPRVTVQLSDVRIGNPARITVADLDMGTSAGALLSRRIEDATLHLRGARVELPLPAFAIGAGSANGADDGGGVTIGSIDEVILSDVEIVAGTRVLRGDIDVVPRADGMTIRSIALQPGDASLEVTGEITSWVGPIGSLSLRAGTLDLVALQAFASDFAAVALPAIPDEAAPADTPAGSPGVDLQLAIEADRAVAGDLVMDQVRGTAHVGPAALDLTDLTFDVFGGAARGALTFALGDTPRFDLRAELDSLDMAAVMTFAGTPEALTGRLSGALDVSATGVDPAAIIPSATGGARVEVVDGTVQGLALVRTVVVAGSGRTDALAAAGRGSEAFSRMSATLDIGGGAARTGDLRFESPDVSVDAAGQFGLDGTNIDLTGRLQLSEALSQEAGRDLVRYTQEDGRVTIPVSVTGSAGDLSVRLETADLLKRAIANKAVEEAGDAIREGLSGLFGR